MTFYPDMQTAFIAELDNVLTNGKVIPSRLGDSTIEVLHRSFTILDPTRAIINTPHRNNNIFAALAETLWVLAGRDDMAFLSQYLPRAPEFSDNGSVWRGAYGPRLRNWNGIDQLAEIIKILQKSPTSRRAVAMIYDPDRDFVESLDVPCNDALHFLIRDNKLHLLVFTRSNDIMWGWSGINSFEWAVLIRILASILKVEVGQITFTIGSLHLYQRHVKRARRIIDAAPIRNMYELGAVPFEVSYASLEHLDNSLLRFFIAHDAGKVIETNNFVGMASSLLLYHKTRDPELIEYLRDCDLKIMAKEYQCNQSQ